MSKLALETERLAQEMAQGAGEGEVATKKAKRERGPKAERKPRVKKPKAEKAERDPLAGLKAKPKGKSLFVNTDGALSVMRKSLKLAMKGDNLSESESLDAKRLVARLESRGVGA